MTRVVLLLALVACGKKSTVGEAGPGSDAVVFDAAPDAPMACASPVSGTRVTARPIGRVPGPAMLVTAPAGDDRLFVIERQGAIRIFDAAEQLLPTPFLDLSADVKGPVHAAGSEQGLLGMAFHPQYATNGLFFIFYTRLHRIDMVNQFRDVLARCKVSADPDVAEPTCVDVLAIPDFARNHNGGMIEFGADGMLYVSTGDGGSGNDPNGNAQALVDAPQTNTIALLGKILRIDVDAPAAGKEYGIPADNPYAAGGGAPEIWMRGLRNPWRWSFDRATGDMWIGDVGQGAVEELDWIKAGEQRGKNLGWKLYEGTRCANGPCPGGDFFTPQDERMHADGWLAIIGGQVYRGTCYPDLVGTYLYTDHAHSRLMLAKPDAAGRLVITEEPDPIPAGTASIHADARGELYLTTLAGDHNVYRLEARP